MSRLSRYFVYGLYGSWYGSSRTALVMVQVVVLAVAPGLFLGVVLVLGVVFFLGVVLFLGMVLVLGMVLQELLLLWF